MRRIEIVDGTGPVQTIYGLAPRTAFPAAVTFCLTDVLATDAATLVLTDSCTGILVELQRQPACQDEACPAAGGM